MAPTSKRLPFVGTRYDRQGDEPCGYSLSAAVHPHPVLSKAGCAMLKLLQRGAS